jgi:hypothetical protein
MEFITFDTETTGFGDTTEICEFAFVKFRDGAQAEVLASLVKPSHNSDWQSGAIAIHGITRQKVRSAPTMASFKRQIEDFIDGSVLLAHNASFDINRLMSEVGISIEAYCTMQLSKLVTKNDALKSLDDISESLNIQRQTLHDATGDAIACGQLVLHILTTLNVKSAEELRDRFQIHLVAPTEASNLKAKRGPKNDKYLGKADFSQLTASDAFGSVGNSVLKGKNVIFSRLQVLGSSQAQRLTLLFGGSSGNNVSKETDYLVLGDISKESTKTKDTAHINARGGRIQVISEDDYIKIAEKSGALEHLLTL